MGPESVRVPSAALHVTQLFEFGYPNPNPNRNEANPPNGSAPKRVRPVMERFRGIRQTRSDVHVRCSMFTSSMSNSHVRFSTLTIEHTRTSTRINKHRRMSSEHP